MLGAADSEYFQSWNSGKHSIVLDLKSQAGREALEALVVEFDAVVNNLRGDQPEKLKIDYASLQSLNPAIVCLHISAYGRDNERRTWPGYDYLMQAEAGLMSITGEPNGPPSRFGPSIVDYMTGMVGMVGLLVMPDARAPDRKRLRRGHLPVRCGAASTRLHRDMVSEQWRRHRTNAPQFTFLGGSGSDLSDRGRMDFRHVHDAKNSGPVSPPTSAGMTCWKMRALPRRKPAG